MKKLFKIIFGTDDNIHFYISSAFLTTALLFLILSAITAETNPNSTEIFSYISSTCFAMWMTLVHGYNSLKNFTIEFMRLLIFFYTFIRSLYTCLQFSLDYYSVPISTIIFSAFGLFLCLCYFIAKLTSIFNLVKNLFNQIKAKLFNSDNPAPSKAKALIENVTAFLVSISALTVAIKSIAEPILQILERFK